MICATSGQALFVLDPRAVRFAFHFHFRFIGLDSLEG